MCEGSAPIDPNELILRRIPNQNGYYNTSKTPPVDLGAFSPRPNDTDGISFYLERKISAQELVDATKRPAGHFYVARFIAKNLYDLGLTIKETPNLGDLPGHLSVIEINAIDYKDPIKKPKIKLLCYALAKIAGQNLVIGP